MLQVSKKKASKIKLDRAVSKQKSKTSRTTSAKGKKKYVYISPAEKKRKFSEQRKVDKKAKATVARRRHDETMRSTGRKYLATDYGKRKGDKKKKK